MCLWTLHVATADRPVEDMVKRTKNASGEESIFDYNRLHRLRAAAMDAVQRYACIGARLNGQNQTKPNLAPKKDAYPLKRVLQIPAELAGGKQFKFFHTVKFCPLFPLLHSFAGKDWMHWIPSFDAVVFA